MNYAPPGPANAAPVANAQSVSTAEDIGKAITLTASDADSDPLTYSIVTSPSHGSLSGTAPNVTYTPTGNYNGSDSFTFRANDGTVNSAAATVSITITAVNDAPVAQAQSVSTPEDTAKAITLMATDVENSSLTYTIGTGPSHGALSGSAPNVTYTPTGNYNGSDSFTFRANDGSANSAYATVSITVTAVNDAPVAQAQSGSTPEDTAKAITLVATDVENSSLTYTIGTGPSHGSLSGTAPNVTYTPTGNYNGSDSFTFRANDGGANSAYATVSITVTAVNDAPVAQAQSVSTSEEVPKAITLAATDVDSGSLTYSIVTGPAHGSLSGSAPNITYTPAVAYTGADSFTFKANDGAADSASATVSLTVVLNNPPVANAQSVSTAEDAAKAITLTGTDTENNDLTYSVVNAPSHGTLSGAAPNITYTPATNYFGSDSFTFKVNDGAKDSTPATVSITVTSVNDIPVAQAQSVTTAEDTAKAITLAATDIETGSLTYSIVTGPAHGSLSGTAPNVTYTPAANYNGSDSFTFKANDGTADSAPTTVSITVTAVNDAPVAQAQSVSTPEDTAKAITLVATDVENSALIYTIGTGPAHGSLSGSAPNVTYTPTANYSGSDSFTFRASDGSATSATATVTITVTAVNDAPVAQAQSVSTAEDSAKAITLVATDAETNSLTYTIGIGPAHGSLSGTAPNVTYTPATNYYGADSFTFKANDGTSDSAPATVTITVSAVNDAPVAQAQSVSTSEEVPKAITLAATDVDSGSLTYSVVTGPAHGSLSGSAPNITYTPAAAYTGSDSFTFKANDGAADSAPATVSIMVILNNPPVANAQSVSTAEDTAKAITLAGTDTENNDLTYSIVNAPSHGTLSGAAPNITYTPATNYFGSDSFTFKANDGAKDSTPATVSITVTSVNDIPVAQAQSVTTAEDTAKAITLAATDVETGSLTYSIVIGPAHGSLSGTAPNVTYTPTGNYNGSDSFTFKANDGTADSAPATVSITVTAVNDAPVAQAQNLSTSEDTGKAITLTATDVENSSLTYLVVTGPAHGSLSGSAPNITYTPASAYTGADSFTFKANDGAADSIPATVSITVIANTAPVADSQSVTNVEDVAFAIILTATDAESDELTYTVLTAPTNGTLSGTAPDLLYTPATNYFGSDSFTFKANDGAKDSATAMVSIVVTPVNDLPVAQNQSVSTPEDVAKAITLVATDVEMGSLSYAVVTGPAHGSLSGTASNLTYTPAANYYGSDSFTFRASDGIASGNTATVSITVVPVNNSPVAHAQSASVPGGKSINLQLKATDIDSSKLTYAIVNQPAYGTLSGTPPSVKYKADKNYSGPDSFTFKANDGISDSAPAMVSLTVISTGESDKPVALSQSVSTAEDVAKSITLVGRDSGSNTLSYVITKSPKNGTLSGSAPNLTYTPKPNYAGKDKFSFTVNNGSAASKSATVSISVTPVNDAPTAQDQGVVVAEDQKVKISLNASDVDSKKLIYTVLSGPSRGTLSGKSSKFSYQPAPDYYGTDSFTYKVSDGILESDPVTVFIVVTPVLDAPVAQSQSVSVAEDEAGEITLTAHNPEESELVYTVTKAPKSGTLSGKAPNLIYTPDADYSGKDKFSFTVSNGSAGKSKSKSKSATVSINVTSVNDAPEAQGQRVSVKENSSLSIKLTGSDPDSKKLTYTVVTGPLHGTLSGKIPSLKYVPDENYDGEDSFTFAVSDGKLESDPATVSINVISDRDDDDDDDDDRRRSDAPANVEAASEQTAQDGIVVDGAVEDWADIARIPFTYEIADGTNLVVVTQKVAVVLNEDRMALLLTACPFSTSDTVLVYFKLLVSTADAEGQYSVDLWTSDSVLYGMVDGQVVEGFEAILSETGALEVQFPIQNGQTILQVNIEEIGCGVNIADGDLAELFAIKFNDNSTAPTQ